MNYTITKRKNCQINILDIETQDASLSLSLFGGQVLSFKAKCDNRQKLWLSENAVLDGSKAIRGGIPICWPWFGPHPQRGNLPAHGYVRQQDWSLVQLKQEPNALCIKIAPENSEKLCTGLRLELELIIGKQLEIRLITSNTSQQTHNISCALHNYFQIQHIATTTIEGLSSDYLDKLDDNTRKQPPSPYQLTRETDRIHLSTTDKVVLHSADFATSLISSGHDSFVVWNPWKDKAQQMPDMGVDSYLDMICVETAVTQGLPLKPGQKHTLVQIIS